MVEVDWDEINAIFLKRSSKNSYLVKLSEMEAEDYQKIRFILDDAYRFPDNQATVSDSGSKLGNYLSEKYHGLSPNSIQKIVDTYCFKNR